MAYLTKQIIIKYRHSQFNSQISQSLYIWLWVMARIPGHEQPLVGIGAVQSSTGNYLTTQLYVSQVQDSLQTKYVIPGENPLTINIILQQVH